MIRKVTSNSFQKPVDRSVLQLCSRPVAKDKAVTRKTPFQIRNHLFVRDTKRDLLGSEAIIPPGQNTGHASSLLCGALPY